MAQSSNDVVKKRSLQGKVVSEKMDKTITVLVERQFADKKYKKQVKRSAKYKAHDESNSASKGDTVLISECRPLSRDKRWLLKKIIEKAV